MTAAKEKADAELAKLGAELAATKDGESSRADKAEKTSEDLRQKLRQFKEANEKLMDSNKDLVEKNAAMTVEKEKA